MIDFVSTRELVDPGTRAMAQLLASVVARFVRDASTAPSTTERNARANTDTLRGVAVPKALAAKLKIAVLPQSANAEGLPVLGELDEDAPRRAIEYLFGHHSPAEEHLEILGGSLCTMREALLSNRPLGDNPWFTGDMRRTIQLRHRWWRNTTQPQPATEGAM